MNNRILPRKNVIRFCNYCSKVNKPEASTCANCGAPLDTKYVVDPTPSDSFTSDIRENRPVRREPKRIATWMQGLLIFSVTYSASRSFVLAAIVAFVAVSILSKRSGDGDLEIGLAGIFFKLLAGVILLPVVGFVILFIFCMLTGKRPSM